VHYTHPVVHDIKDRKFWKQITTLKCLMRDLMKLFTTSKIENFESKSQRHPTANASHRGCSRHQRSKILKANHNTTANRLYRFRLFTTSKIENFESKSQHISCYRKTQNSCSRHQRSKILKANHNDNNVAVVNYNVVHDIKDRKFWKQITTLCGWDF